MARIRTVKPEFFRHRKLYLAECESSLPLRIAFAGMWTVADREGRFKWEPEELKLDCLPYDNIDFSTVLDALEKHGFIESYEVDGRKYGCIPSWGAHQHINVREAQSSLPAKNINARAKRVSARVEGKGKEGKGKEGDDAPDGADPIVTDFEIWYAAYPSKKDRGHALKEYKTARKKVDAQTLLASAQRYRDDPKRDPAFTYKPHNWLRGECWADEAPTGPPVATIDPEKVFRGLASMVAKGIRSTKATITQDDLARMVHMDLVTDEQAVKYGWIKPDERINVPQEALRAMGVM